MDLWKEKSVNVSDSMQSRKSIRDFTSQPVPDDIVREILEKAARAPSGGNTQPWHCHVVIGDAKKGLTELVFKEMENGNMGNKPEFKMYPSAKASKLYMARRRKLGYDMYSLMGIDRDDQMGRFNAMKANFEFFGAPVGILVTVDRIVDVNGWGHVGMFIENVCLIAREYGLSTCLQEAWSTYHDVVYDALKIPKDQEVLWCGIALGYANPDAKVNTLHSDRETVDNFATFHSKI